MSQTDFSTIVLPEAEAPTKFNLRMKSARVALLTATAVAGASVVYYLSKKNREETETDESRALELVSD